MTTYEIRSDDILVIKEVLTRAVAVDIDHYRKEFVYNCIERRLAKHAITSVREYIDFLRRDPQEPQRLRAEFSVYHSQFTRDPMKYRALQETVIPEILRKKRQRQSLPVLRVWSAGCAGGEEPYSIAMVLEEMREREQEKWDTAIYATDLNPALLEKARQGIYHSNELSKITVGRKYIRRLDENHVTIADQVRQRVHFSVSNLLADIPHRDIDILLCRNVLIYFATPTVRRLLLSSYDCLNDGGYLVLGNTEGVEDYFMCHYAKVNCGGEFFYRKITRGTPEYIQALEKQKTIVRTFGMAS